jgi:flagellar hook-basal body complex protein FliE
MVGNSLISAATSGAASGANGANGLSELKKAVFTQGTLDENAPPFSGVIRDAWSNLEGLERQASSAVEGLVSGQGVDVHQAMIATEKSDQAFEMALAVRGKMVSAYQSLMGVQF